MSCADFCTKWAKEYSHELQQRSKWKNLSKPLRPGMLAIINDDNELRLKWALGRIIQFHPGSDTITRVVMKWSSETACSKNFANF